jgi:hypothetical protein
MSTYYKFVCKKHNQSGGFLSRQAWGEGNFSIIETFKFLMLHKGCRPYLVSEDEGDYETPDDAWDNKKKFIEDTHGIMPHSNDWSFVNDNEWEKVEELFEKSIMENNLRK